MNSILIFHFSKRKYSESEASDLFLFWGNGAIINVISDTCSFLTSDVLTPEPEKRLFTEQPLVLRQLGLTQEPQVGRNYRN